MTDCKIKTAKLKANAVTVHDYFHWEVQPQQLNVVVELQQWLITCTSLQVNMTTSLFKSWKKCTNACGSAVPVYLFMRPAWISSCARSWLTTAQAEPTMKCKMTSQRSMAYWSRLFMSRAWRSGPRALPSSTQDLILWMNTKPSLSFCKEKKKKRKIKYISYWFFFSKHLSVKPLEQPRHRLFKWIASITDNCACNATLLLLFFMTGYINHSNTRFFTKPVTLRTVNTTNRNILTFGIYRLSLCIC